MTDTKPQLSAEEALAIDAISGASGRDSAPAPSPAASADTSAENPIDAQFDLPVDSPASQGYIGSADAPRSEHHDHDHDHDHDHGDGAHHEDDADMIAMRSAMLDSAELANRAAGLAAKAAADMHSVTAGMGQTTSEMQAASAALVESHDKQRLNGIVVLAVFGALMLTSMTLFGIMSYRLQSRITQADEMLLAVGKRIVAMNDTMELITGAGETLRDISARQDTIVGGQAKLDARLDDMLANAAQASAAAAAKPADPKAPDLAKLIQSLDAKLQSQSNALNALSSQVRAAPAAARPDPAAVRREVEAALQKQKAAEAAARPVVVAPAAPPAPPPKPKEALVQYPRTQPQGKETP